MRGDLHIHSVYSDGTDTPEQIARTAKAVGLSFLSVTDHDTARGRERKRAAAEAEGLIYIDGIEFSAYRGDHVHILGYGYDPLSPAFARATELLTARREERNREMLRLLRVKCGIEIAEEEIARTEGSYGSMHICRRLVERGYARSVSDAFDRYVGLGAPAFVSEGRPDPAAAVRTVRESGGVAVLAHPGKMKGGEEAAEKMIRDLADAGLNGIEARYSSHTEGQTRYFCGLAKRLGLIATCGSDYHGAGRREAIGVPSCALETDALTALGIERERK